MKPEQTVKQRGKINYPVEDMSFCEPRLAEARLPGGMRSLQLDWKRVVTYLLRSFGRSLAEDNYASRVLLAASIERCSVQFLDNVSYSD